MKSKMARLAINTIISTFIYASFVFATIAPDVQAADDIEAAISYVKSLSSDIKIYVWPMKIRPLELLGNQKINLQSIIDEYNSMHEQFVFAQMPIVRPLMSIYTYEGPLLPFNANFIEESRLPDVYKKIISTRRMDFEPCVFANFVSRDTWVDGGVIFMDMSRLPSDDEQHECLQSGLDYLNGFPAPRDLDYTSFPPPDVRHIIVDAVAQCSAEGPLGSKSPERTKDGLTPLPSLECVARVIGG